MQEPTGVELWQVRELLEQIAMVAAQADRNCYYFPVDSDDLERHRDHANNLRQYFQRVGWMADTAAAAMGGEPLLGDASCWLLPLT